MLRFHKKGMFSPAFRYVLVLVVGAAFLAMFFYFGFQMIHSEGSLTSAKILNTFEDTLTAFSVSGHSSTLLPDSGWPQPVELRFGKGLNCGRFAVDNSNFVLSDKIIFSLETLKAKQFSLWTVSWYYPFKVANLFYISNKRTKYFLVYDQASKEFVQSIDSFASKTETIEHIPKIFDVESIPKSSVSSKLSLKDNYDLLRFVSFGFDLDISSDPRLSYSRIDFTDCSYDLPDDACFGSVSFNNGNSFFIGKPLLYAAILSGSLDSYECSLGLALDRLSLMSDLFLNKISLLSSKTSCDYSVIRNNIQSLSSLTSSGDASGFDSARENIDISNNALTGDRNCVLIY